MYYRLKDNYLLRGWQMLPYALVDSGNARTMFIRKPEMDALLACDGFADLSSPGISEDIRSLIPQLENNGIIEPCQQGEGLHLQQRYHCYPARYIRTAHWSVTGRCNYRCKHCYMSAPDAKYGELGHEAVIDIVSQLAQCGVMEVSLTGGEPLVRRDFLDIVDELQKNGIRIITIYSNGRLVTDRLLEELADRRIRPEFNMSYDGVGWHDWLRGIDGAERIVEDAFRRCREKGFPTGAEMCIHQGNRHTLRETVRRLAELGCRSLKTNPVSNVGAWKENGFGESISINELYQLYLDYIPHYYEDGMPLSIMLGGFFSANPKHPQNYDIPLMKNCKDPQSACICGHSRMVMYISAEGRTLPCMALSGMPIQEKYPLIGELGLANCITDSCYMSLINTRASEYFQHNPECAVCEYAMQCLGGCRASSLDTTPEDIMGPDMAACTMFRGGWVKQIFETMNRIIPVNDCPAVSPIG